MQQNNNFLQNYDYNYLQQSQRNQYNYCLTQTQSLQPSHNSIPNYFHPHTQFDQECYLNSPYYCQNVQNTQNTTAILNHGLNKIPAYSGNLSTPPFVPQWTVSYPTFQQNTNHVFSDTSSVPLLQVGQDKMNSPNLIKTPTTISNGVLSKHDVPEVKMKTNNLDCINNNETKEKCKNKLNSLLTPFNAQKSHPIVRDELPKEGKESETMFQLSENVQSLNLHQQMIGSMETSITNWDEIVEEDDTPAKADSFSEYILAFIDNPTPATANSFTENVIIPIDTPAEVDSFTENVTPIDTTAEVDSCTENFITPNDTPAEVDSFTENVVTPIDTTAEVDSFTENVVTPIDTTAEVDSFTENVKTSVDDIHEGSRQIQSNKHTSNYLSHESNEMKRNDLPISNKVGNTTNWKDIFDPDSISISKRDKTLNKKNMNCEKINMGIIEKIEFKDKFFHVITVKGKPAVISREFYPQFVSALNWQVINKIVDLKYKPFVTVSKHDNPELFAEFDKIELCGNINKKLAFKFNKASISYVSEIAEVFSTLNVIPDAELLDKLKEIEGILEHSD